MKPCKKPSPRRQAINGLRKAYLNLDVLYCMNELKEDQKWIEDILTRSKRRIGRMLRHLEPKRRLPSVLLDTRLGQSIREARKSMKCQHDWKPEKERLPCIPKQKGDKWETCRECGSSRWTPPQRA